MCRKLTTNLLKKERKTKNNFKMTGGNYKWRYHNLEKENHKKWLHLGVFFPPHSVTKTWKFVQALCLFSAGGASLACYVDSPHGHNRPLEVQALFDELSKFLLSLVLWFVEKQRIANVVHVLHASQLRDTCWPHLVGEEKSDNERAECRWICYIFSKKASIAS